MACLRRICRRSRGTECDPRLLTVPIHAASAGRASGTDARRGEGVYPCSRKAVAGDAIPKCGWSQRAKKPTKPVAFRSKAVNHSESESDHFPKWLY
jgi:hypothetical protein